VGGHPTHDFIFEDDAAGRSFNFVDFGSSFSMEVSRMGKGVFLARNASRNPVVIEVISVDDFPLRHSVNYLLLIDAAPGLAHSPY
jgi:hypothetical protein